MAPRLLAAFGSQRERFNRVEELQVYSGISPVISSSGKSRWIHFRFSCPKFLRQTFHEWAGHSIAYSTWARAYYQLQRSRGKQHHAAVRALAFKWIRIAFRCWKRRVAYRKAPIWMPCRNETRLWLPHFCPCSKSQRYDG
jgi:hypothetical protein